MADSVQYAPSYLENYMGDYNEYPDTERFGTISSNRWCFLKWWLRSIQWRCGYVLGRIRPNAS